MPLTLTEETFRGYRDLAAKLAWKYWKTLPPSAKVWIDPEDLVAHAYLCMVEKFPKYDHKKSLRSTYMWYVISNDLHNFVRQQCMKKRTGIAVSIDAIAEPGRPDLLIRQREALYSLAKVYETVSPECRLEMQRWFGQDVLRGRYSYRCKRAMEEFRQSANRFRLTPEDCRTLMRSGVCLP